MMAPLGMSLFFILSGFLITRTLLHRTNVNHFLIRRFCRILPLAFAFLLIALPLTAATPSAYLAHFLFYANMPLSELTEITGPFWRLCVEMQFYSGFQSHKGRSNLSGILAEIAFEFRIFQTVIHITANGCMSALHCFLC